MVEMQVQRVQISSRAYHRVVLRARDGDANLHIVIGPSEARAIAIAHRGQEPARPLSYDMACSLLAEAGVRVGKVSIIALEDGIYYAEVQVITDNGEVRVVDSRPSDAIALALRSGAPIFAAESVLDDEEGPNWEEEEDGPEVIVEENSSGLSLPSGGVTLEEIFAASDQPLTERQQLENRLRQAIAEEAYEEAARLRDRLSRLDAE
ncbi:MAG: bifunctional nuclease family protein [Candidatus Latescibacterota bacterium]|nr:bifunctional nuclease family protein [Candidatus Latescibacterota bacterium]